MKWWCLFFLLLLFPDFLLCHKINIFATVEGNRIYTQSYASDGSKIKGGLVEVYDKKGNRLLMGKTDSLGEFSFLIPKREDLKIVLIGGMGHRAETEIGADELPEVKSTQLIKENEAVPKKESATIDTILLRKMIEDILKEQLHPLVRILAEKEKKRISFNEVIGGIGYIFGIMGIVMFFLSRKKNA